ncbi:hypothetical protein [Zunongwangia profunda]|jgi:hypothetical protein|uniref:hypothetical protein n=1 Tax=Zunongwangia profunda TaxID=398743 RepID=UPI001D19721D|nr:hypothetical protein [Zunongwangia profunda]MCC4230062.1 hypothetical protein [Zunongwangia profunda]|tara:strand:- start:7973 stop:8206 length:234 start_codon:yes stop_codon:yes gene_type:complete
MKEKKSKLFESFKLKESQYSSIIGGNYTSTNSDTNHDENHDIAFDTLDQNGQSTGLDIEITPGGADGNRDTPMDTIN